MTQPDEESEYVDEEVVAENDAGMPVDGVEGVAMGREWTGKLVDAD